MLWSFLPLHEITSQLKQLSANDVHIRKRSPIHTDKFVCYLVKSFSREEMFHFFEKLYTSNSFGLERGFNFNNESENLIRD